VLETVVLKIINEKLPGPCFHLLTFAKKYNSRFFRNF